MAQPPSSDRGKLNEKNFIQPPSRGVASWLWVLIAIVLIAIFWIFSASMLDQVRSRLWEKPFLQVTNREFSLFLWQNPEYMRRNQSKEIGYLPGFVSFEGKMTPDPKYADQFVAAPPKFLYRYHLWKFFLGEYVFNRSIPNQEFQAFLAYSTEWQPENWKGATDGYLSLLTTLENRPPNEDLADLSVNALPIQVRQAFIGWKNFFKEGDEINQIDPTPSEMKDFIRRYPHYARHYWRNVYPDYLKSDLTPEASNTLSKEEIPPFLRVAFYNYSKSKK
ncbi:MAG: hypothetical protein WDZ27_01530 [Waddliaceae bacterium]